MASFINVHLLQVQVSKSVQQSTTEYTNYHTSVLRRQHFVAWSSKFLKFCFCAALEKYLRKKSVLNIYLTWQDISDNSMFTHRLCALQRRWENNWSISLISWTSESKNQNSKLLIDQLSPHRLRQCTSANNTSSSLTLEINLSKKLKITNCSY